MKRVFLAVVMAVVMTGCIKHGDVELIGLEDMAISPGIPVTAVDLVLRVDNSSGKNIRSRDAEFVLTDSRDREIAVVVVAEDLLLPRRSTTDLLVPLRVTITNPLAGLKILGNFEAELSKLYVTGGAQIKIGGVKRRYAVDKMPVSMIISSLKSGNANAILQNLESI